MTRLVFEPHNGFGSIAPDGEPYPVGYISEEMAGGLRVPLIALEPVCEGPHREIAHLLATAPALLEALKVARERLADMLEGDDGQAWSEARKALPKIDAALDGAHGGKA